jgi:hypothetical protein
MNDEPETETDNSTDAITDALDDAVENICSELSRIEAQLRTIATGLDKMHAITVRQIELALQAQANASRAFVATGREAETAKNAGVLYESGHGPRRDGDTYGIVAAQPMTETSPEPAVHADDPPGHLRPADEC